eukprot:14617376-Alexandrium_andersonii.AAC.1
MDFFHAVAPWYCVLRRYTTNIARSPHVAEDTKLCLLGEDDNDAADAVDPTRQFILNRFQPVPVEDALTERAVKQHMRALAGRALA